MKGPSRRHGYGAELMRAGEEAGHHRAQEQTGRSGGARLVLEEGLLRRDEGARPSARQGRCHKESSECVGQPGNLDPIFFPSGANPVLASPPRPRYL